MVEFALVERPIDEERLLVQVNGEFFAPAFHVSQEGVVHAHDAFGDACQNVSMFALHYGVVRQCFLQVAPFVDVL
ncbi:MAG: hypothetical protein OXG68_16825 [Chloroflexi bacterium]|nr:hypothetical protein [Chloroflexota bacterium]